MREYVIVHAEPYFNKDNRVLLVLKDKPAWQKGFLNMIGGKVEPGETPEDCAFRELKEETGYTLHNLVESNPFSEKIKKMGVLDCDDAIIHCFQIYIDDYLQPEPQPREGETEIFRWYPWHVVRNDKRLMPNLRLILPLVMAGVYNWTLKFPDTNFTGEVEGTISITMPSNLHPTFEEKKGVTKIIEKGHLDSKWDGIL
jgi:8-oxo-dGTP pyrophosphatase MutT (NUDIX family)